MTNKIYRIELSENELTRLLQVIPLEDKPEFVAHRDENGVIFDCGPAPERYHIEIYDEDGEEAPLLYYALPSWATLDDGSSDGHIYFPPAGSFIWRNGAWEPSLSYEEYFSDEHQQAEDDLNHSSVDRY